MERYIIHYNDKSENKPENRWPLYTPINPGATSAIISGLKPTAMYNVRVSAEFSNTNFNGTSKREGDLSEIHVADIYRRMFLFVLKCKKWNQISLGTKYVVQYDNQLSRPYNMTYTDLTSNSVKLLFSFNETNIDPHRQIQKLEVCCIKITQISSIYHFLGSL